MQLKSRVAIAMGGLLALLGLAAHAQDEAKRYRVGQIKVGDRIEVSWGGGTRWAACTVLGARPLQTDPSKVDAYQLRCDQGFPSDAIADSDHVRMASAAAAPAPAWNVTDASKVGPKGANSYGARNPHLCPGGVPGGALNPALALQSFVCSTEGEKGHELYLVENARLQIVGATRYDPRTQTGFSGMDTRVPPVAIRGSYSEFQCTEQNADPKSPFYNYNTNCARYDEREATGYCYKTVAGAWRCNMADTKNRSDQHTRVAPPR